jgi:hypothetical protein
MSKNNQIIILVIILLLAFVFLSYENFVTDTENNYKHSYYLSFRNFSLQSIFYPIMFWRN